MTKNVISAILLTAFTGFAHGKEPVQGISCGGNQPETLGASLMITLTKDSDDTYKVILSRQSKDMKIDIKNQVIAKGLACEISETEGAESFVVAECSGGSRMSPVHFSVVHVKEFSARGTSWLNRVSIQSKDIIPLNEAGLDINSVFGGKNMAKSVISVNLSGPNYLCKSTQ
ncbi:MAG: hypothetical protein AABY64_08210 [Bdellovibrionota bacterium]